MKREKRDDAYLWDMLDAAREARELISGLSYDDLMSRKVVRLALERVLEITGEAARNVSPRRRNRRAIPWQDCGRPKRSGVFRRPPSNGD